MSVIQSEVSQKEKHKHCLLMHIYGIYEDSTDEPICWAVMEMQTQNTGTWGWTRGSGEEGAGRANSKDNTDIYTTTCEIVSQ